MVEKKTILTASVAVVLAFLVAGPAFANKQIVHDAEYQKVLQQYGAQWANEDKELAKRLADLEAKHGKKPNIIHFIRRAGTIRG